MKQIRFPKKGVPRCVRDIRSWIRKDDEETRKAKVEALVTEYTKETAEDLKKYCINQMQLIGDLYKLADSLESEIMLHNTGSKRGVELNLHYIKTLSSYRFDQHRALGTYTTNQEHDIWTGMKDNLNNIIYTFEHLKKEEEKNGRV